MSMIYIQNADSVSFSQSNMHKWFFLLLGNLDVYINLTGDSRYPYSVKMSEVEFLDCQELVKDYQP